MHEALGKPWANPWANPGQTLGKPPSFLGKPLPDPIFSFKKWWENNKSEIRNPDRVFPFIKLKKENVPIAAQSLPQSIPGTPATSPFLEFYAGTGACLHVRRNLSQSDQTAKGFLRTPPLK